MLAAEPKTGGGGALAGGGGGGARGGAGGEAGAGPPALAPGSPPPGRPAGLPGWGACGGWGVAGGSAGGGGASGLVMLYTAALTASAARTRPSPLSGSCSSHSDASRLLRVRDQGEHKTSSKWKMMIIFFKCGAGQHAAATPSGCCGARAGQDLVFLTKQAKKGGAGMVGDHCSRAAAA